jgi:hypothetical protein
VVELGEVTRAQRDEEGRAEAIDVNAEDVGSRAPPPWRAIPIRRMRPWVARCGDVVAAAAHGLAVRDVAGRVRWSGGVWRVARGGVALCRVRVVDHGCGVGGGVDPGSVRRVCVLCIGVAGEQNAKSFICETSKSLKVRPVKNRGKTLKVSGRSKTLPPPYGSSVTSDVRSSVSVYKMKETSRLDSRVVA